MRELTFDPKEKGTALSLILEIDDLNFFGPRSQELFNHYQMALKQRNYSEASRILTGLIQLLVATKLKVMDI